ncbi:MAG TPA: hypothetical protein VLL54_11170 [Pyrinomonadaceae bacterium]|nr:hypothetical protein [Pyrinomonadaceae bacterium]
MRSVQTLIDEARTEYARHEMEDPFLLDGTSEMHARNALGYLLNERWKAAVDEAEIAAKQRSRWQNFREIVTRIYELRKVSS